MGFFFQAEDGIRDPEMSRGLGDVYKRQFLERSNVKVGIGNCDFLALKVSAKMPISPY